jgi:hypothetical protein
MTEYDFTKEEALKSVAGDRVETAVSVAIAQADKMAESGGCHMIVVRTKQHGVCIYTELKMSVAKDEIIEEIYSTDNGYIFWTAA